MTTESMSLPRLIVAGAHSGAGKTTISLALMRALTRRGMTVHPYKIGPDYIDPAFHQAAAGRPSRNLDSWILPPETLTKLFSRRFFHPSPSPALSSTERVTAKGSEKIARASNARHIAVIEGVMGLFDGQGSESSGSTAHVASLLNTPVVLLINGEGISLSAAALVSGYAAFQPHPHIGNTRVAAVIINRVSGPRHYEILRQCIEEHVSIPCLGCLPKNVITPLPSRHLGLVPANELDALTEYLDTLATLAENYCDIDALLSLAESAPSLPSASRKKSPAPASCPTPSTALPTRPASSFPLPSAIPQNRVRIGLARDAAFSFYYPDNLELLEDMRAEIVPFSPLRDAGLPAALDGLYLGGGFPEIFARELEANHRLRAEIAAALEAGMPAYAECGGMLYLCASLRVPARATASPPQNFAMAGFFPEQAEMTTRLQPFGYVTLTPHQDCLLGAAGTRLRAHEFHYARLLAPEPPVPPTPAVFSAAKAGGASWKGGLRKRNVLAMFPHLFFHACPQVAARFLKSCRRYRHEKGNTE
ncbi:MAG: cobyrinate a,c-diamide synthase [Desulfovibrio sp.]|jgi:cobyrinic acid a,c-diamide synthase|nr:cobyrinate a,c-diamide synthase [Desulfovibrio sp.]